jgi:hypothetical protein
MTTPYQIVTLWDGRRGYFYTARFTRTPIFQPVNERGEHEGIPELADAEDHEVEQRAMPVLASPYCEPNPIPPEYRGGRAEEEA